MFIRLNVEIFWTSVKVKVGDGGNFRQSAVLRRNGESAGYINELQGNIRGTICLCQHAANSL